MAKGGKERCLIGVLSLMGFMILALTAAVLYLLLWTGSAQIQPFTTTVTSPSPVTTGEFTPQAYNMPTVYIYPQKPNQAHVMMAGWGKQLCGQFLLVHFHFPVADLCDKNEISLNFLMLFPRPSTLF